MSNFSELKNRVKEWNNDDEDNLIRKIKQFSDNYKQNTSNLASNLKNLQSQMKKIEINYHHDLNMLKNMSIKKFVEHSIAQESPDFSNRKHKKKKKPVETLLTKDEKEASLINKFQQSISISLDNLNIKNLIDTGDNKEVIDDDDKSMSSSKYFSNMNKSNKAGIKLPYIIGQEGFFKSGTLGIVLEDAPSQPSPPPELKNDIIPRESEIDSKSIKDVKREVFNPQSQSNYNDDDLQNRSRRVSSYEITGRKSIVKTKIPSVVIEVNDNKGANIPKIPAVLAFPVAKKKPPQAKPVERKESPPKEEAPSKPASGGGDFRSQLLARMAKMGKTEETEANNDFDNNNTNEVKPEVNKPVEAVVQPKIQPAIQPPPIMKNILTQNTFKMQDDDEDDGGKLFSKPAITNLETQPLQTRQKRNTIFDLIKEEDEDEKKKPTKPIDETKISSNPISQTNLLNRKDTVIPKKKIEEPIKEEQPVDKSKNLKRKFIYLYD